MQVREIVRDMKHLVERNLSDVSPETKKVDYKTYLETRHYATRTGSNSVYGNITRYMQCSCSIRSDKCIVDCPLGAALRIHRSCWAGLYRKQYPHFDNELTWILNDTKVTRFSVSDEWYSDYGNLSSLDGWTFASGQCDRIECTLREETRNSDNDDWLLGVDNACVDECNCGGPLCSVCMPDTIRLPGSVVSVIHLC